MNVFLIDYENVHTNGFIGMDKLKKKDKVYIFYSIKSENIYMDIMNTLLKNKVSFKMFKLNRIEKNALDFQLVLYLGTRLKKYGKKASFYIVSNDNGYQSVIDFAKEYFGIIIKKIESIEEAFNGSKQPLLLLENNPVKEDLSKSNETVKDVSKSNKIAEDISKSNKTTKDVSKSSKTAIVEQPTTTVKKKSVEKTKAQIEQKRLEIEKKLHSNSNITSMIVDNQIKQISKVLVDDSIISNQDLVVENIKKIVGGKKVNLISIILITCRNYVKFKFTEYSILTREQKSEIVENKLKENKKLKENFSNAQLRKISNGLVDKIGKDKYVWSYYLTSVVNLNKQHLIKDILECCSKLDILK